MAKKVTGEMMRNFADAGRDGRIEEIRATLQQYPGAARWTDHPGGRTALHGAAAQGYTEVIELLLAHGADVNARDSKGRTPLMYAAESIGMTHLQPLLEAGADTTLRDLRGKTALEQTGHQHRNAALIIEHEEKLAARKAAEQVERRKADIAAAVGEMLTGSTKPVAVRPPLRLKARRP